MIYLLFIIMGLLGIDLLCRQVLFVYQSLNSKFDFHPVTISNIDLYISC